MTVTACAGDGANDQLAGDANQDAPGAEEGGNGPGHEADPTSDPDPSDTDPGSEAGSGGAGVVDPGSEPGSGGSSAGGAPPDCIQDDAEPNDSPSDAVDLGELTDLDSTGVTATGTFHEGENSDWFEFVGTDVPAKYIVNPTMTISGEQIGGMCAYFKCTHSKATGFTVFCGAGAQKEKLTLGGETIKGCCTEKTKLSPNINCTGTSDDSTNVYVEAYAANVVGKMCADYTLDVHY